MRQVKRRVTLKALLNSRETIDSLLCKKLLVRKQMEKNYLEAVETWDNFSLIVTHKVATSPQNPQWYEPLQKNSASSFSCQTPTPLPQYGDHDPYLEK